MNNKALNCSYCHSDVEKNLNVRFVKLYFMKNVMKKTGDVQSWVVRLL